MSTWDKFELFAAPLLLWLPEEGTTEEDAAQKLVEKEGPLSQAVESALRCAQHRPLFWPRSLIAVSLCMLKVVIAYLSLRACQRHIQHNGFAGQIALYNMAESSACSARSANLRQQSTNVSCITSLGKRG